MNKHIIFIALFTGYILNFTSAQESKEIRLLVRGDDIGMSHSINEACIAAYQDGIMRTVEVMIPCPWFPEAVKLLNENPGLEVGVHLVLNSEWEEFKCRPLTDAPSLVDENGYFYPMVFPGKFLPDSLAFVNVEWDSTEVDYELRDQIDLALKHLPHINHLSPHMGVMLCDPDLIEVFEKVAKDYNFKYEYSLGITRLKGVGNRMNTHLEKEAAIIEILENLQPGTWMLLRHPALDTPEMQAISHPGYNNVAEVIERRGIQLITYQDLLDTK